MNSLVWLPTWHRPGESLWSAMNKVAFTTNTSVANALMFISGLDVTAVRGLTLAADARIAVLVCQALELAFSCAGQLFAGVYPMSFAVRQYLQFGLRWCPECLSCGGYHSATFQDWRREHCPWHGCRLQERCPKCRSAVDPLCEQPWSCNQCGEALYHPGKDWLGAFKAPARPGRTNSAEAPFFEVVTSPKVTHFHRPGAGEEGAAPPLPKRKANVLITQAACEELSAFTDTVLREHRHCSASHAHLSMLQCKLMRFTCPEAAAAVRLAAWMGVGAFSMETGWANGSRPPGGLVHEGLHWDLDQMPGWCHRVYLQACIRAWYLEAVGEFRAAAARGDPCEWEPWGQSLPDWFYRNGTFSLNKAPSLAALEALASTRHQSVQVFDAS